MPCCCSLFCHLKGSEPRNGVTHKIRKTTSFKTESRLTIYSVYRAQYIAQEHWPSCNCYGKKTIAE